MAHKDHTALLERPAKRGKDKAAAFVPRTKEEAETQINDFVKRHKRSLDALARL